jgi:hypothetical protein
MRAIQALNPELHTIGWIAILSALDREGRTEATAYTQQMAQFAASFSVEQARAWPDRTKKIFRSYTNFLVANNLPSYGMRDHFPLPFPNDMYWLSLSGECVADFSKPSFIKVWRKRFQGQGSCFFKLLINFSSWRHTLFSLSLSEHIRHTCPFAICRSLAGVLVLRTALERFRPSAETITPLHAMLALLCLLSRMHSVMLPILAEHITRISPAETATDAEDVLLYLYYGGTVYLGLRRFREAEDMFASAISGMCGTANTGAEALLFACALGEAGEVVMLGFLKYQIPISSKSTCAWVTVWFVALNMLLSTHPCASKS